MAKKKKSKKKWYSGRKLDKESAKKKQQEVHERNAGAFHELKSGYNKKYEPNHYFILPPWRDLDGDQPLDIWKEVWKHKYLTCPRLMANKPCKICDALKTRKKDATFVNEWKPRPTGYVNAIRKKDIKKASVDSVKVLRFPSRLFDQLIDYVNEEDRDPSDPDRAYPVCIRKTGFGQKTRYRDLTWGDPMDISEYLTDEIFDAMYDLDNASFVQPASKKQLLEALGNKPADEDEDEEYMDEDEESESDEDEDEEELKEPGDEDEDEDEDEEEEDEDDLSEFDEDDEDEEEEEPPPTKKRKTKRSKSKK
jgi:hypothetical protein